MFIGQRQQYNNGRLHLMIVLLCGLAFAQVACHNVWYGMEVYKEVKLK